MKTTLALFACTIQRNPRTGETLKDPSTGRAMWSNVPVEDVSKLNADAIAAMDELQARVTTPEQESEFKRIHDRLVALDIAQDYRRREFPKTETRPAATILSSVITGPPRFSADDVLAQLA